MGPQHDEDRGRFLFADQLGPHFIDDTPGTTPAEVVMVVSRQAFARRRMHRAKAHLLLSSIYHRAAELGRRATVLKGDSIAHALAGRGAQLSVCDPTSRSSRQLVRSLGMEILPSRGFVTSEAEFDAWVSSRPRKRLLMEDFYRHVRRRTGILMDAGEPVGGRWNFDADNRQPPPRGSRDLGLPEPWWPREDDIDAEVRDELDRWQAEGVEFIGEDGPRLFAATRSEALRVLDDFIENRLPAFGPFEDAALQHDWVMAHSLLSAPLNLGLLHPLEVIQRAVTALEQGSASLPSVEGLTRQIMGWRDYVWHLYWHLGSDYQTLNALDAREPLPEWFANLDAEAEVRARCLSIGLGDVRSHGWTHHIVRLMVLGNWALQRGFEPQATVRWFTDSFVDGHEWVMSANVIGMALHADGGIMATKPYAGGGAYINRMTDFCRTCDYRPQDRTGDRACPVTAGYWAFLDRHEDRFRPHPRMAQATRGLDRIADRSALVEQEATRGGAAP